MEDLKALSQVAEFHRTFRHPILETATIPEKKRSQLRIDLLAEELKELQQAVDNNDIIEVADALCDLQYVLAGAVLEFGLADKFKALFDEVHRSNMSKACKTAEEAEETLRYYLDRDATEAHYQEVDGRFLVYRNGDHKTLKSINYSPANLKSLL